MLGPETAAAVAPTPAAAAVGLAWEVGDSGSELSEDALTQVLVVIVAAVLNVLLSLLLLLRMVVIVTEVG